MNLVTFLEIVILLLCSLVIIAALNEWLFYNDPIMFKIAWKTMFPSYLFLTMFGIIHLFSKNELILFLKDVSLAIFLYSAILHGVFLVALKLRLKKNKQLLESSNSYD